MAITEQDLEQAHLMELHGGGASRYDMVIGGTFVPEVYKQQIAEAGGKEVLHKLGEWTIDADLVQVSV